jgi:signal transduction histidine kinase
MSLRTRLLLSFGAVVLVPLSLLAFGLRQQMTTNFHEQLEEDRRRVADVVEAIDADFHRESEGIRERLAALVRALPEDNRFRQAAVAGDPSQRAYLLDYAGTAMRLTGLSMLKILDGDGQIVSSGHFRNEHGRREPGLVPALTMAQQDGVALVTADTAERAFVAVARAESVHLGGRTFTFVGGVEIDEAFLRRLARDEASVSLAVPGLSWPIRGASSAGAAGTGGDAEAAISTRRMPLIRSGAEAPLDVVEASLTVTQSRAGLGNLLRTVDSMFLVVAGGSVVVALVLAVWMSSRISRPLAALADRTAVLDLDRLDVSFDDSADEVGTLSRVLKDLADRLRVSTVRVREAERRATIGDLARQINHDIKNGLIPLRNVMRHLVQVGRDEPGVLASVLAERRQTLDSSIAYLETLATNYERLAPPQERRDCDLNALVADVVRGMRDHGHVEVTTQLSPGISRVLGDPVAFRRIVENLTSNAVDSLQAKPGRITISTEMAAADGEPPVIRVTVADTGCGMSKEEAGRIFEHFYTTKAGGTGLGLSIVRRLVTDLHGTLRVDSEPGKGTRMIVEVPAAGRR